MPETAGILVEDASEMRQAILDADQLVDLFLILGHGEARLRVIEDEQHLLGDRVLVDRHRHGAEALGRQHRPVELRPVVADDGDLVAALHAECCEATGNRPHSGRRLGPAMGLPDAEFLLAHRRPVAVQPRVVQHELRKRVVGRGFGLSAGARLNARRGAHNSGAANDDVANANRLPGPMYLFRGSGRRLGRDPGAVQPSYRAHRAVMCPGIPPSRRRRRPVDRNEGHTT